MPLCPLIRTAQCTAGPCSLGPAWEYLSTRGRDSKATWLRGSDTYWSVYEEAFAPGAVTAALWTLTCSLIGTHLFSLLCFIIWVSLSALSAQSSDDLVIMEDGALRIIVVVNATGFSDCLKDRHGWKHMQRLLWDNGSIYNASFQQVNSGNHRIT